MLKYRNKPVKYQGHTFHSKAELSRYIELCVLKKSGLISDLQLQPKFELLPKQKDERAVFYFADFSYVEDGKYVVEDVKGIRTRDYVIKRKLFKYLFPDYVFREICISDICI